MSDADKQQILTLKEAVTVLYYAQHQADQGDFQRFSDGIKKKNVSWDFNNDLFLEEVRALRDLLAKRLNLQNESELQKIAEAAYSTSLHPDEISALENGFESVRIKSKQSHKLVYDHTEKLVTNFVNQKRNQQTPLSPEKEQELRNVVFRQTTSAIEQGSVQTLKTNLSQTLPEVAVIPQEVIEAVETSKQLADVTEAVILSQPEIDKGQALDLCLQSPHIQPELIMTKNSGELETIKVLRLSDETGQAIESLLSEGKTPEDNRRVVFGQAIEKAKQGVPTKAIDDIITTIGGPGGKAFIDSVITTVLGSSLDEIQTTRDDAGRIYLGGQIIKSTPETENKIQEMQRFFDQRREGQQKARGTTIGALRQQAALQTGATQQVGAPIPRLETEAIKVWAGPVQSGIRVYLETASVPASAFSSNSLQYFLVVGTDAWRQVMAVATRRVTSKAIRGASALLVKKGTTVVAAKTGVVVASGVMGGVGGAIIGWFASGFIGKGISLFASAINRLLFPFRSKDVESGLIGGGEPQDDKDSLSKTLGNLEILLPILLLASFLFIGVLAVIKNITVSTSLFRSSQVREEGGIIEGQNTGRGFPHAETTDPSWDSALSRSSGQQSTTPGEDYCVKNPTVPACQTITPDPNNPWPIISSNPNVTPHVTQGPGGSYSHSGSSANAVDIGTPIQSAVLSPVDGVVENTSLVQYKKQYADNSGYPGSTDGGGYGNFIDIRTTDGHLLRIAHLAYGSMPTVGTVVTVGTQIGRSGNTGNSSGSHIHFEYRNPVGTNTKKPPSINNLFPVTIPVGCSSAASCGYIKAGKK